MIKGTKHEDHGSHYSVFVESPTFSAWVDIEKNGENADWNQYIFFLDDPKDVEAKKNQDDPHCFEAFTSAALEYLEAHILIITKDGNK